MEGWKQACREICAAKGEPPCFKLDGHENCEPCEDCKVVGVVIDEMQAEINAWRGCVLVDAQMDGPKFRGFNSCEGQRVFNKWWPQPRRRG